MRMDPQSSASSSSEVPSGAGPADPGASDELSPQDAAGRQAAPGDESGGQAVDEAGGEGETGGGEALTAEQQLEVDLAAWKDLALRRQADFDNYRKRIAREKAETSAYANAALLEQLLPVIDSFEMGMAAARAESAESMIFQGMAMVQRQLNGFLESQHVSVIDSDPEAAAPFDPAIHEAVGQEPSDTVADGHVLRVQRKGYRLRDRLLRPALVVVSTGGEGAGTEAAGAATGRADD